MKKQGYSDRKDESLGMKDGAERNYSQSYKDRRDESYGMDRFEKGLGHASKPHSVDYMSKCQEDVSKLKFLK
ncbi:MAG: hypothetical protein R3230_01230 [Nitrosopumilaceae archaeon]|nr:hypothetical protein [Nitrosopumilaceae archaeon]